jgi:death-on-curing protein
VRYLDLETALQIIDRQGWGPVRDVGLLDSALARPASSAFGKDAYPTPTRKAAALLHSLVGNHALVDGNKRIGLLFTYVFLRLNGYELLLDQDEAVDLIVDVASGLDDLDEIEARLHVQPRDLGDSGVL